MSSSWIRTVSISTNLSPEGNIFVTSFYFTKKKKDKKTKRFYFLLLNVAVVTLTFNWIEMILILQSPSVSLSIFNEHRNSNLPCCRVATYHFRANLSLLGLIVETWLRHFLYRMRQMLKRIKVKHARKGNFFKHLARSTDGRCTFLRT